MHVVVICGGLGTRLGGLTEDRPKYLVPVLGKPFCDWQLELLLSQGFDRFTFAIGHLGGQVRAHLDYHWHDLDKLYSEHPPTSVWDAYRRARVKGRHAVIYGDSYLPLSADEVKRAYECPERVYYRWQGVDYGIRFLPGKQSRNVEAPSRFYEVGSKAGIKELEAYLS